VSDRSGIDAATKLECASVGSCPQPAGRSRFGVARVPAAEQDPGGNCPLGMKLRAYMRSEEDVRVRRDDIYRPILQLPIQLRGREIHPSQQPEALTLIQTVIEIGAHRETWRKGQRSWAGRDIAPQRLARCDRRTDDKPRLIVFLAIIARLGGRRKKCSRDHKQKHYYFLIAQPCLRSLRSLHGASMLLVAGSIKPDQEPTHGLRFANATKVTGLSVYFVYRSIFKTLRLSRCAVARRHR
jgi:hypothetical protein